jgi:3,4-dihydroxy 2-butanone 4-phosphate synthase/GTP cyclohydrolase II
VVLYLRPSGTPHACGLYGRGEEPVADFVSETVTWILRDLGLYTIRLSEDAPALGLVMFGAIRDHGLSVESQLAAC